MLSYKTETRPGLVALYTTSGQETERVNSYNPRARTGLLWQRAAYCVARLKLRLMLFAGRSS